MIHSGTRCKNHNFFVGGSRGSYHVRGKAADFHVVGVPLEEVYKYCDDLIRDRGGLGLYPRHIHIDVRGKRKRWKVVKYTYVPLA